MYTVRVAECAGLTGRLTRLGLPLRKVLKVVNSFLSERFLLFHRGLCGGLRGFDSFEQNVSLKVLSRLLTPER